MTQKTKTKQKSWTEEEDLQLKDCVLDTVRNGGTQLNAFTLFGENTDRTAASVAFRWNSKVRNEYKEDLIKAKEEAKRNKDLKDNESDPELTASKEKNAKTSNVEVIVEVPYSLKPESNTIGYEEVIIFIKEKKSLEDKYRALYEDYDSLQDKHNKLKKEFEQVIDVVTKVKEFG